MTEEIKIKITMPNFSVEFEGEGSFLNQHLEDLLSKMSKMSKVSVSPEVTENTHVLNPSSNSKCEPKLSTNDIAVKLGVKAKDGKGLMWAAITKIVVVDNIETFSVKDVRNEMKTSSFWDKGMNGNVNKNIKAAANSKKLISPTTDKYRIPSSDLGTLRDKIGL